MSQSYTQDVDSSTDIIGNQKATSPKDETFTIQFNFSYWKIRKEMNRCCIDINDGNEQIDTNLFSPCTVLCDFIKENITIKY